MSNQDAARRRRTASSADQAVSRRQLLSFGATAATIVALPALAHENGATIAPDADGSRRAHLTDEQHRLDAVVRRYGPELGPGS
jgi:hypothetical protein